MAASDVIAHYFAELLYRGLTTPGAIKEDTVDIMCYVNIRFIANVHLYPNTIVPVCFLDTLQQQHLSYFFYKINTENFSTSFSL